MSLPNTHAGAASTRGVEDVLNDFIRDVSKADTARLPLTVIRSQAERLGGGVDHEGHQLRDVRGAGAV